VFDPWRITNSPATLAALAHPQASTETHIPVPAAALLPAPRIVPANQRVHESTKTESLTEAKRILADRQAAVRAQGLVFDNLKRTYLFEELANDYLTWQSVQNDREQQIKYRLLPLLRLLGKKDLNRISSEDLVHYRLVRSKEFSARSNSKMLVSQTSVNRELAVLGAAYNWASGEAKYQDVIKRNPFVRRKHLTKVPVKVRGWFDPDSKRRFMEACDQLPTDRKHFPPQLLKAIFLVLVGTGMRIVECLTLRKRQVKLEYRLVQLEGWQTKNKKAGDVDLRTDEAFHVFRMFCRDKKDGELLFQWPEGDSLRQPGRCKVKREPGQILYRGFGLQGGLRQGRAGRGHYPFDPKDGGHGDGHRRLFTGGDQELAAPQGLVHDPHVHQRDGCQRG